MQRIILQLSAVLIATQLVYGSDYSSNRSKHFIDNKNNLTPQYFIIDSWITGFFFGLSNDTIQPWRSAIRKANNQAGNDLKIWGGIFTTDKNKRFGGQVWEVISRLTYQIPQTIGGFLYAHFENTVTGNTQVVCYKNGATLCQGRRDLLFDLGGPAVTLGSYLIANSRISADVDNSVFQHEYGHYIQSQAMGIAYFGRIGIPSLRSQHGDFKKNYASHDFHPAEQDANRRAFLYFNENVLFFQNDTMAAAYLSMKNQGWDFNNNPLAKLGHPVPYGKRTLDVVDFQNKAEVKQLDSLRVRAKWYDYLFPFISGTWNAWNYNH